MSHVVFRKCNMIDNGNVLGNRRLSMRFTTLEARGTYQHTNYSVLRG